MDAKAKRQGAYILTLIETICAIELEHCSRLQLLTLYDSLSSAMNEVTDKMAELGIEKKIKL